MVEMQFRAILFWRLLLMSVRLPDDMVWNGEPVFVEQLEELQRRAAGGVELHTV
jgi:hypothetical protein